MIVQADTMKKLKNKSVIDRYDVLRELIKKDNSNLEPALGKALSDRSPRIRSLAAETIGEKQLTNLLPKLGSMTDDPSTMTRVSVIESIGILSPPKEIALALVKYLQDDNELIRVVTAEALGEIGNKDVIGELENSLLDSSPLVRGYSVGAIRKIGKGKSLQLLKKYLDKENEDRTKVDYYGALYSLGRVEYLDSLLNLMNSDDPYVRGAVPNKLQNISLSDEDKERTILFLRMRLKAEPIVLVRSYIEECIKTLLEYDAHKRLNLNY